MAFTQSLWMATSPPTSYPSLAGEADADVAVVGGGMAGLCAAAHLAGLGMSVAVLEANRIGAGVSGYTTAKVTSGHALVYESLANDVGVEHARAYADANQWGLEWIASQGIECDLSRRAMSVFAEDEKQLHAVRTEFDRCLELGLPVGWSDGVELPLKTLGALTYANQAQFHPRKFIVGLAERLAAKGVRFYERTRVTEIEDGEPCRVTAEEGSLTCRFAVCASHYPVLDPGLRFSTRMAPYRDYALAARVEDPLPSEMSIGAGEESMSFRTQDDLLIVSGVVHKVGQADTTECFEKLEAYVREHFRVESIPFRWSTQDNMTPDRMPYIGRVTGSSEHAFVITGFNAWGMAASGYAGKLIADLVTGKESPWADTFDPGRFKGWESVKAVVKENLNVAKRLVGDKLSDVDDRSPDELQAGEGAILEVSGDKLGVFRDDQGLLHAVVPKCTHLGCDVMWNSAEQSWDCPCHGSRFDHQGNVIQGPAVKNLDQKPIPHEG